MDKAQFERKKEYGAAIAIARQMLRRQLITPEEYQKLTQALNQEHRPAAHARLIKNGGAKGEDWSRAEQRAYWP